MRLNFDIKQINFGLEIKQCIKIGAKYQYIGIGNWLMCRYYPKEEKNKNTFYVNEDSLFRIKHVRTCGWWRAV